MHSLLEDYLAEVEAKLSVLPAKRREEEMREMRQHLADAVRVNRELGQNEDEVAANALTEFGSVEEASEGILWSWKRYLQRKLRIWSFWWITGMLTASDAFICFQFSRIYAPSHHVPSYQPYCTILCSWVLALLILSSQFLPAKYQQPSWMWWWFVSSAQ